MSEVEGFIEDLARRGADEIERLRKRELELSRLALAIYDFHDGASCMGFDRESVDPEVLYCRNLSTAILIPEPDGEPEGYCAEHAPPDAVRLAL